jgi:predicted phage terminase large subunit-like protein
LAQELKKILTRPVKPNPVEHDKIGRLYVNQHKFEAGLVSFPEEEAFLPELEIELLSFPQGHHDDMVDSISQALSYQVSGYNAVTCLSQSARHLLMEAGRSLPKSDQAGII